MLGDVAICPTEPAVMINWRRREETQLTAVASD